MQTAPPQELKVPQASGGSRWAVWWFRIIITLTAALMYDQAILAGQFLAGTYAALQFHATMANVSNGFVIASLVFAILLRRKGRGPLWPVFATIGLILLAALQTTAGYDHLLALHVPLGVMLIVLVTLVAVWAWVGTKK
jgi:hypothetical protein